MNDDFLTLAAEYRYEIEPLKGSRFLACVAPASTPEAALEFIQRISLEFAKATHNCWAFRIGGNGDVFRSNDDGEPSGSAGRPILQQIEGHGLTHTAVVVTRWFGGTKLGVGGLMRAYGGAAGQTLDRAPTRVVTITQVIKLEYPYACSGAIDAILARHGYQPLTAEYTARVRLTVEIAKRDLDELEREITDRTAGRTTIDI